MQAPSATVQSTATPEVKGLPLIGVLPQFFSDQINIMQKGWKEHGDFYRLDLGFMDVTMLCHPRHAQHVFIDQARNYRKEGPLWDSIRTLIGNGLVVSQGDLWKRQRRMMNPHFHHSSLTHLADLMVEAIDEGMTAWDAAAAAGEPVNIAQEMTNTTMRVIVKTMFGTDLDPAEVSEVSEALTYALNFIIWGMLVEKLPAWFPLAARRRYQQSVQTIDKVVFKAIQRNRQSGQGQGDENLIAMLTNLVDADTGDQMTMEQLRDEAVTIFLAGFETTANAMAWSYHFLTQQPEQYERLQAETLALLGDRRPTFEELPELTYARMVMQEALRLYGPVAWLSRVAAEDDYIDGHLIPAGHTIAVANYLIQRHPDFWPDPARFDPERFTPENSAGRHKMAWIPFGAGQRLCIGRDFAIMEGQFILSRLAQHYNLRAVPGKVAQPATATTIRPKDGVWVYMEKR